MSKSAGNTRAVMLGMLFAMVAFSYALATSDGVSDRSVSAAARSVGTNPLHFTNRAATNVAGFKIEADGFASDYDLGDAVAGSNFTRYCRAAGGVAPYKFASTISPTLSSLNLGLDLQLNGLIGTAIKTGFALGDYKFKVTVSSGTNNYSTGVTKVFHINLIDGKNVFRFAVDSNLGEAMQNATFFTQIPVIGNTAAKTFTASNVKVGGTAQSGGLNDVGLALAPDGTLFGKLLKAGTLTFDADCVGVNGAHAQARAGAAVPASGPGQSFTLVIVPNIIVSSNAITTAIQIKGGAAGKDSIKYAGLANLGGKKILDLRNQTIELRIGSYVTPNTPATPAILDEKGKTIKSTLNKTVLKTAVTLKGAVSSKGQVKIAVGKETFGALATSAFGVLKTGTLNLVVSVKVGSTCQGTEVLPFVVTEKSGKWSLTYKNGAALPSGNFLMTSIAGKDDTKGATDADAWKVGFIAQGSLARTASAVVSIGAGFTDDIAAVESKGKVKSTDKSVKAADQVSKLAMDGLKGKGSLQTTLLAASKTGIAEAGKAGAGKAATFDMNITLTDTSAGKGNAVYSGEGALGIFSTGKAWTSKTPK